VTATSDDTQQNTDALVASLCHEVGNQLAAVRLTGHVLKFDKSKEDLEKTARSLEELATQAGTLVSLIGPLMGASKSNTAIVNPVDLLEGLTRAVPDTVVNRVAIVMPGEGEIPEIAGNFHMLSGLLLALVLGSCESSPKDSEVKVSLKKSGQEVSAFIEDQGALSDALESRQGTALRGRELMLAVADCLLEGGDGCVQLEGCGPDSKETRLRVILSRET
jgi:nitrogen-specific signal transduction histidine kinase